MYLNYFGLKKSPFGITPDTSLFFDGAERGDILQALLYAINSGEGIIKVVGEVGSGKTMLSRMLSNKVPDNIDLVFLLNPRIKAEQVLYAIAYDLGLNVDVNDSSIELLHLLQKHLLSLFNSGKKVVLIVDEAQQMPLETLEEIRLLSNLETETEKLLQIVLLGQPELDQHLNTPKVRQLKERIAYSFYLNPLSWKVAKEYLEFRLAKAGNQGREIFSLSAIKLMSSYSDGTLRRLNMLADKSLLAAFLDKSAVIEPRHVRIALKDNNKGRENRAFLWVISIVLMFVVLLGGAYFLGLEITSNNFPPISKLAVTEPVTKKVAGEEVSSTQRKLNSKTIKPDIPIQKPPFSISTATVAAVTAVEPLTRVPVTAPVEAEDAKDSIALLNSRLQAFGLWQNTYSQSYTIRLMSAVGSGGASVERFLRKVSKVGNLQNIYVTRLNTENSDYVIYLGNYSGYSEALAALASLPESMKKFSPYVSKIPK